MGSEKVAQPGLSQITDSLDSHDHTERVLVLIATTLHCRLSTECP